MAIKNRLPQEKEVQTATPLLSDAYEVYWCSTDDDHRKTDRPPSLSGPGDAYSELWQLWDAG